MAHPLYGRWSESPQRRFPLGESEDTYDTNIVAQQVADHAFNLREYWAGAQAYQEAQRRWAQRKAMARSTVAARRPSGAPIPSDFAAAARRHPEGVRAAHNAQLVAQLQELDDEKVELWLAQVRAHAVAHGEERRRAVATQAAHEAEQCRPPQQGEATAGTDALVSKALLREYQALAVAGDAVDPDPTEALVEQLDEAFVDSFVVPPPPPQSAPPDPHTAAMDGLEHTVAAATASPLPTPLPAGPASTASVSPGTSCVALASAAVSPPSVQPADAPIGSIGAGAGVTVMAEESGESRRRSGKARRSARETSLERLAKPRGSMHSYSFYKCRPSPPPPPPAPAPARHAASAASSERRARTVAVRPAPPVDAAATAVVGAPPRATTAAAKAAAAKEAAAAALVREAWAAMEAWDDALDDSNVQQLDRAVEELRLDLQCKGLRTSLEDF